MNVKRKFYRLFLLWLIAFVLIIFGNLLQQYTNSPIHFYDSAKVINKITKNISTASQTISEDLIKIQENIQNDELSFSSLVSYHQYPTYIYRNDSLIYWNTNQLFPTEKELAASNKVKFFKTKNGSFIQYKTKFSREYKIYTIIQRVELEKKYPVQNEYLQDQLNSEILPIRSVSINSFISEHNIYTDQALFLFSIDFDDRGSNNQFFSLILIFIGFIFLLLATILTAKVLYANGSFIYIFILISGALLFFSMYIELYFIPTYLLDLTSEKPTDDLIKLLRYFELSIISISYLIFFNTNNRLIQYNLLEIKLLRKKTYEILLIFYATSSIFFVQFLCTFLSWQYASPIFGIYIESIFDVNINRVMTLLASFLLAVSVFLSTQLAITNFSKTEYKKAFIVVFCSIILLESFYLKLLAIEYGLLLFGIYAGIIYFFGLHKTLERIRYVTYLYFFWGVFFVCTLSSFSFEKANNNSQRMYAKAMASKIIRSQSQYDEKYIFEASQLIVKDKSIHTYFFSPILDKNQVGDMIRKKYLEELNEKYDIKIYLYDTKGISIEDNLTRNYYSILKSIKEQTQKTSYKNVFRQRGEKSSYFVPINLRQEKSLYGYVLLEIRFKKLVPFSISPALLIKQKKEISNLLNPTNYAIYDDNKLVSSFGNYNYFKNYNYINDELISLLSMGYNDGEKTHQYFQFPDKRGIIITNNLTSIWDLLSNFSFLFICWAIVLATFILGNTFYYKINQVSTTFTTKIQLFVNFAFFIPLLVVCVAVFYIVNSNYRTEIDQNFISKAEAVSNQLLSDGVELFDQRGDRSELLLKLQEASKFTQSDLNFFSPQGVLLGSTQAKLLDYGLITKYINPQALSKLEDEKENVITLKEQIGLLSFNTVYLKLKSYDNATDLGIIAIPFFSSDAQLENKIMDALKVVLSIFTLMFILFLAISFAATRILTSPLILLTKKIKSTNLLHLDQPLQYDAKDEIGLLVREYNLMLLKLEQSKKALSANDKEYAWKEMAKQVAHEIKNPLTPIKLTLQNMQRFFLDKSNAKDQLTQKSITLILEQIDNLAEIADSFSTFTQMPIPVKEPINLKELLQKAVFLFQSNQEITINTIIEQEDMILLGDEKLLNRIVINLLKNAIESRSTTRDLIVDIKLRKIADKIELSIADNGDGILPQHISNVFLPNFSTKNNGSGIGLAVVKKGIEQMGGEVKFETEVNKGTTFIVTF